MTHVDVIKNEWLAGYQVLVARVYLEAGSLRVDSPEPDLWNRIVLRPYVDNGRELTPDNGESFLAHLHAGLHGDYLFATEPHDEQECPYHHPVVAIRPSDPQHARVLA